MMQTIEKSLIQLLLTLLLCSAGTLAYAQNQVIQRQVESRLSDKAVPNAIWAVSVRDDTGTEIASINSDKLMVPASNMKLITSAAVIEELGSEYRFTTPIYGDGRLQDSTWIGDIYIVGSGDPSINGDNYDDDAFYVFKQWSDQLKNAGIYSISGKIFGNTSIFDGEHLAPDWDWYDLPFYYAAEVGPLSFNSNTVFLEVNTTGAVGSTPSISWFPFNTDYVTFVNKQRITRRGTSYRESYKRFPGNNTITLASTLPQNYVETEALTVSNPTMYFLDSFIKYLLNDGFGLNVTFHEDPFPNDWSQQRFTLLASHSSEPLSVLLMKLNKDSDNLYAEMLLKTLAYHRKKASGSIRLGEIAANERFSIMKLDTNLVSIRDGSGLASTNLVSTSFLSQLLFSMTKSVHHEYYNASLTIAGIDGTFKNRMRGTKLEGNLRGKSGSISRTRAFSGYLTTKSGKTISFSMIANNFRVPTREIDRVHEALALYLYDSL